MKVNWQLFLADTFKKDLGKAGIMPDKYFEKLFYRFPNVLDILKGLYAMERYNGIEVKPVKTLLMCSELGKRVDNYRLDILDGNLRLWATSNNFSIFNVYNSDYLCEERRTSVTEDGITIVERKILINGGDYTVIYAVTKFDNNTKKFYEKETKSEISKMLTSDIKSDLARMGILPDYEITVASGSNGAMLQAVDVDERQLKTLCSVARPAEIIETLTSECENIYKRTWEKFAGEAKAL